MLEAKDSAISVNSGQSPSPGSLRHNSAMNYRSRKHDRQTTWRGCSKGHHPLSGRSRTYITSLKGTRYTTRVDTANHPTADTAHYKPYTDEHWFLPKASRTSSDQGTNFHSADATLIRTDDLVHSPSIASFEHQSLPSSHQQSSLPPDYGLRYTTRTLSPVTGDFSTTSSPNSPKRHLTYDDREESQGGCVHRPILKRVKTSPFDIFNKQSCKPQINPTAPIAAPAWQSTLGVTTHLQRSSPPPLARTSQARSRWRPSSLSAVTPDPQFRTADAEPGGLKSGQQPLPLIGVKGKNDIVKPSKTYAHSSKVSTDIAISIPDRSEDNHDPPQDSFQKELIAQKITAESLIKEIKSIYSSLVIIEAKCIHVDRAEAAVIKDSQNGKIACLEDHWKPLVALHRTLLHEQLDFFLATQHPSAPPDLKKLAIKYSMPARLWKHGIHSFLEILRHRLPSSREYMISFIYFSYQMLSLLYETVDSFQNVWTECLGDLSRYRMAVEDPSNVAEREVWANTARQWYQKVSARTPETGRLYHHLGILARGQRLRQLYLYNRALTSMHPFVSARESMAASFEVIPPEGFDFDHDDRLESTYSNLHALMYHHRLGSFGRGLAHLTQQFPQGIKKNAIRFREDGAHYAISNVSALFEHGMQNAPLRQLFAQRLDFGQSVEKSLAGVRLEEKATEASAPYDSSVFEAALKLLQSTFKLMLETRDAGTGLPDPNVFPHVHIILAFHLGLATILQKPQKLSSEPAASILASTPWDQLCVFLNNLSANDMLEAVYERINRSPVDILPEDYLIQGQVYASEYLGEAQLDNGEDYDEERLIEKPTTSRIRATRIAWIACRLSQLLGCIDYDPKSRQWQPCLSTARTVLRQIDLAAHDEQIDRSLASSRTDRLVAPASSGAGIDGQNVKTVVYDSSTLLKQQGLFRETGNDVTIIIPNSVYHWLDSESSHNNVVRTALQNITEAYQGGKDIQIWTGDGKDITKETMRREAGNTNNSTAQEDPEVEPQDEIIEITRRATDLAQSKHDPESSKVALVTDNTAVQEAAQARNLLTFTSLLYNTLRIGQKTWRHSRSSSCTSAVSHSPAG